MFKKENRELWIVGSLLLLVAGLLFGLVTLVRVPLEELLIKEPIVVIDKYETRAKTAITRFKFKGEHTGKEFEMHLSPSDWDQVEIGDRFDAEYHRAEFYHPIKEGRRWIGY